MLSSRIIPSLLISNRRLVKTIKFSNPRYLGDPLNAVKIFNEKRADEILILDISATANGVPPDIDFIRDLASECRMPLTYGGGIKSLSHAMSLIELGVEKVAISSAAIFNPDLICEIVREIGSQSLAIVIDIACGKNIDDFLIRTSGGKIRVNGSPYEYIKKFQDLGAGEIVINSIDRDGMMCGYDLTMAHKFRNCCSLPLTILGGCSCLEDIGDLISEFDVIGAAAGSVFFYKGGLKAVLINYPDKKQKELLYSANKRQ